MSEQQFDPTNVSEDVIPEWDADAAEEQPLPPARRYGGGTPDMPGQAVIKSIKPVSGVAATTGKPWGFISLVANITTAEDGTFAATSQPFGRPNTSLTSKQGSSWPKWAQQLGITPGTPTSAVVGLKVIVETMHGKDRDGTPRVFIKDIWRA